VVAKCCGSSVGWGCGGSVGGDVVAQLWDVAAQLVGDVVAQLMEMWWLSSGMWWLSWLKQLGDIRQRTQLSTVS
jgi:hypothetical protein